MAVRNSSLFYTQCAIAAGTLGATAICAFYLPFAAPFCFTVGICAIIWNEVKGEHQRVSAVRRRVDLLEKSDTRLFRETAMIREDFATFTARNALNRRPAAAEPPAPPVAEAVQYERIVRNIHTAPAAAKTPDLTDTVIQELMRHAIDTDRIDVFAQPIVRLPSRRTAFYELYTRLRAGSGKSVPAQRYLALAHQLKLIPAIDNILLMHTLKTLREQDIAGAHMAEKFFLNLSPEAFSDSKFISDLLAFVERHPTLARRLVFEFSADALARIDARTQKILKGLSKLSCRFSVDHVTIDNFSPSSMGLLTLDYIKMDAPTLMKEISRPVGFSRMRNLKDQINREGIALIIGRIEQEDQVVETLDFDIAFGQGHLFGAPEPMSSQPQPRKKTA